MTLQQIYDLALSLGIKADPREESEVRKQLEQQKKDYEALPEKKKKYFDKESLSNPYADTRILYGNPLTEVKKVIAGIDADVPEIVLADRLNDKGAKIDLVISHHPNGPALAGLHEVMEMQVDVYAALGVPVNVGQALMGERIGRVMRGLNPHNHNQAVDAAKLLNMPLLALHTAWDNISYTFIKNKIFGKEYQTVGEVLDTLMEIPEFVEATKGKAGPIIVSGSEKSRVGKIDISFTGGTDPSKEMYSEIAKTGIGTVIAMHVNEDTLTELKKAHVNVINTGHIASDSIGANLFLDELEKKGIETLSFGGLIRVKRN